MEGFIKNVKAFFHGWDKNDWKLFTYSMIFLAILLFGFLIPWIIGYVATIIWILN